MISDYKCCRDAIRRLKCKIKTQHPSYPLAQSVENPSQLPQQVGQSLRKSRQKHTGHNAIITKDQCPNKINEIMMKKNRDLDANLFVSGASVHWQEGKTSPGKRCKGGKKKWKRQQHLIKNTSISLVLADFIIEPRHTCHCWCSITNPRSRWKPRTLAAATAWCRPPASQYKPRPLSAGCFLAWCLCG